MPESNYKGIDWSAYDPDRYDEKGRPIWEVEESSLVNRMISSCRRIEVMVDLNEKAKELGFDEGFDDESLESNDLNIPTPAGEYRAKVDEAKVKTTSAGDGEYIKFRWEILGPDNVGRMVFTQHNIENPNDTAVEIGLKELKEFGHATGLGRFPDPENIKECIGFECAIRVKVDEDTYQGQKQFRNSVSKFMDKTDVRGEYDPQPEAYQRAVKFEKGELDDGGADDSFSDSEIPF